MAYDKNSAKKWREENKEHIKNYRLINKERLKQKDREYRKRTREHRSKQFRNLRFGGNVEAVFKKYHNKCWLCLIDLNEKTGQIHHRDGKGFSEVRYKANNDLSNLVLLCHGCHRRVHALMRSYVKAHAAFMEVIQKREGLGKYTALCPECFDAMEAIPIKAKKNLITAWRYECFGCQKEFSFTAPRQAATVNRDDIALIVAQQLIKFGLSKHWPTINGESINEWIDYAIADKVIALITETKTGEGS